MVKQNEKKYPAYSKNVRLRPTTIKLINKLDKSRTKTLNEKIFDLLSDLESKQNESKEVTV